MSDKPHTGVRLARRARVTPDQAAVLSGRCAAILATSADDTAVASLTAGRVHDLWLPPALNERIHVATVTPGRAGRAMTRSRRPELVAHRLQVRPEDVLIVDGLMVTSIARTWRASRSKRWRRIARNST